MPKTLQTSAIRATLGLLIGVLLIAAHAHGNGSSPGRAGADTTVYLPAIQVAQPPCDAAAIVQLRAVSRWQGNLALSFKASASGTWPDGDSEVTSVDHMLSLNSLVLSKTNDSPTFVRWQVGQMVNTGQMIVNDSDVRTFKQGGSSSMTAQFTKVAGSDVLTIILYPDQCKLRFELDGIAVGPVTGDLFPEDYFTLCATMDINAPRAGAQAIITSVPAFLSSASASSFDSVRKVGLRCRVGGGFPNVGQELFTAKTAWLLDGATTSGSRGKGDSAMGTAQVTYSFAPLP